MPKKSHTHSKATKAGKSSARPRVKAVKARQPSRATRATALTRQTPKATPGRQASTQPRSAERSTSQKAQRLMATRLENIKSETPKRRKPLKRSGSRQGRTDTPLEHAAGLSSPSKLRADETSPGAAAVEEKVTDIGATQISEVEPMPTLRPSWTAVAPFAMILRQQAFALKLMLDALQVQRQFISGAFYQRPGRG